MTVFDIHAGHNPAGKIACGASDLLDESKENRLILSKVKAILENAGHKVYDSTCNDGYSQGNVLSRIVSKINSNRDTELSVSLHFNAFKPQHHHNGTPHTPSPCHQYDVEV